MRALVFPVVLVAASAAATAFAQPALIASARIDPALHDKAAQTSGLLENGVPGNLLAGLSSGLAYAGGDRFLALPDRGPNAVPYNNAVDNTTSYIPRFHTFAMKLAPSSVGLPFVLAPDLLETTLLSSGSKLAYGDGKAAGLGDGAPSLNTQARYYFSGRSDNFAPGGNSLSDDNARFDPEGIRLANDGRSVFVSDEYGPHIYQFDRASGQRVRTIALPEKFAVVIQSAQGDSVEIAQNTRGRVANKGMEGLAITPDGKTLVGIMQSPLLQDGGTKAAFVRIVTVDIASGATHEYAYPLTSVGTAEKPKLTGVSEIVAINDHEFLVDERDGKGLGDGTPAAFKRLFHIDLAGAADVSAVEGEGALGARAVTKTVFVDLVAVLSAKGIDPAAVPAKIEGLSFGPDVTVGGHTQHTLWIASDNDFLPTAERPDKTTTENPSVFYVLGFDPADLPGYQPQHLPAK